MEGIVIAAVDVMRDAAMVRGRQLGRGVQRALGARGWPFETPCQGFPGWPPSLGLVPAGLYVQASALAVHYSFTFFTPAAPGRRPSSPQVRAVAEASAPGAGPAALAAAARVAAQRRLRARIRVTTRAMWVDSGRLVEELHGAAEDAVARLPGDAHLAAVERVVADALRRTCKAFNQRRPEVVVIAHEVRGGGWGGLRGGTEQGKGPGSLLWLVGSVARCPSHQPSARQCRRMRSAQALQSFCPALACSPQADPRAGQAAMAAATRRQSEERERREDQGQPYDR